MAEGRLSYREMAALCQQEIVALRGETYYRIFAFPYSRFRDEDRRLEMTPVERIDFAFRPTSVLLADGTRLDRDELEPRR